MHREDEGVGLARWDHVLGADAVAATTAAVVGFATRGDIAISQREATESAIAAVLDHAAAARGNHARTIAIDGAADGRWLSLMIRGTTLRRADENAAVAAILAAATKIEWPDDDHPDDRLLLEITMAEALRPAA